MASVNGTIFAAGFPFTPTNGATIDLSGLVVGGGPHTFRTGGHDIIEGFAGGTVTPVLPEASPGHDTIAKAQQTNIMSSAVLSPVPAMSLTPRPVVSDWPFTPTNETNGDLSRVVGGGEPLLFDPQGTTGRTFNNGFPKLFLPDHLGQDTITNAQHTDVMSSMVQSPVPATSVTPLPAADGSPFIAIDQSPSDDALFAVNYGEPVESGRGQLDGSTGFDSFVFHDKTDGTVDVLGFKEPKGTPEAPFSIFNFVPGHDVLDLRGLSPVPLHFDGDVAGRAGGVWFEAKSHLLSIDTSGDGRADMALRLDKVESLSAADLRL